MTIITKEMVWNVANVTSFRGIDVVNGQIDVSKDEFIDYLDEVYGEVSVCGFMYSSGSLLEAQDPVAFRVGLGDYESQLQSELEDQIESEDEDGIDFDKYDPSEITEEDDE